MNKYIFWIITLAFSLLLLFMIENIGATYLLGDHYEKPTQEYEEEYLTIEEFKVKLGNEESIDVENLPFEIQLLSAKAFLTRIIVMIFALITTVAVAIIIKGKRVEFNVMMLDNSERKINIFRITMYIFVLIVAFLTSQTYPSVFLLGWVLTLLWIVNLLLFVVWMLNIVYAIKENRARKAMKL
ncbi:MAG: hypothetical protein KAQ68_04970 [Clostridiales bacterium]|nr:hypothetical protein [Clostridiales bacterium]